MTRGIDEYLPKQVNQMSERQLRFLDKLNSLGGVAPTAEAWGLTQGNTQQAQVAQDENNDTVGNGVFGHLADSAQAGFASSLGGMMRFAGSELSPFGGDWLESGADYMDEIARRNTPTQELEGADYVASAIGNAIGSGLPSAALALGALATGNAIGAGALIANVASKIPMAGKVLSAAKAMWQSPYGKYLVSNVASSPMEAASEAGNLITEMREKGYSDEEISAAAWKSAAYNTAWLTVANALESKYLGKIANKFAKSKGAKGLFQGIAAGAATDAISEGGEEFGQNLIGNAAEGVPYDYAEALEAARQGAIGGAFMGGVGAGFGSLTGGARGQNAQSDAFAQQQKQPASQQGTVVQQPAAQENADVQAAPETAEQQQEQPASVPKLSYKEARAILQDYSDNVMFAGEAKNRLDDLLETGSKEQIIDVATRLETARLQREAELRAANAAQAPEAQQQAVSDANKPDGGMLAPAVQEVNDQMREMNGLPPKQNANGSTQQQAIQIAETPNVDALVAQQQTQPATQQVQQPAQATQQQPQGADSQKAQSQTLDIRKKLDRGVRVGKIGARNLTPEEIGEIATSVATNDPVNMAKTAAKYGITLPRELRQQAESAIVQDEIDGLNKALSEKKAAPMAIAPFDADSENANVREYVADIIRGRRDGTIKSKSKARNAIVDALNKATSKGLISKATNKSIRTAADNLLNQQGGRQANDKKDNVNPKNQERANTLRGQSETTSEANSNNEGKRQNEAAEQKKQVEKQPEQKSEGALQARIQELQAQTQKLRRLKELIKSNPANADEYIMELQSVAAEIMLEGDNTEAQALTQQIMALTQAVQPQQKQAEQSKQKAESAERKEAPASADNKNKKAPALAEDVLEKSKEGYFIAENANDVKQVLKPFIGHAITNKDSNITATYGSRGINKLISSAAIGESIKNGYSRKEHMTAAANVIKLFEDGKLVNTHRDKKVAEGEYTNVKSVKIINSPFQVNGEKYNAKITVKESVQAGNKIYSIELLEIEKPGGILNRPLTKQQSRSAPDSSKAIVSQEASESKAKERETVTTQENEREQEAEQKKQVEKQQSKPSATANTLNIFEGENIEDIFEEYLEDVRWSEGEDGEENAEYERHSLNEHPELEPTFTWAELVEDAVSKDLLNGNDEEYQKHGIDNNGYARRYYDWLHDKYGNKVGKAAESKETDNDATESANADTKEGKSDTVKTAETEQQETNLHETQKMSDNVEEEPAKADEQGEVQALDSWDQAFIDDPLLGPDLLRRLDEKISANKKKASKSKKATPKKTKEEVEVEVAVRNEEIQAEIAQEGEGKDAIDAYIDKITDGRSRGQARRYFNVDHPERRDFVKDVIGKNPKVSVKKSAKDPKNNSYFLTYDGQENAEKIVKVEAVIISKLSNTEISEYVEKKVQTKAEKKAAEEAKYISEIPEEADDDYCEHLEQKRGSKAANETAKELFQPSKDDPTKTWFEVTREAVFRDLQLNDYIESDKHIFGKSDAASDYYEWLESKYAGKVKQTARGDYDVANDFTDEKVLAREEQLEVIADVMKTLRSDNETVAVLNWIGENYPDVDVRESPVNDLRDIISEYKETLAEAKQAGQEKQAYQEIGEETKEAIRHLFDTKFKATEKNAPLDNFDPDTIRQLINIGNDFLRRGYNKLASWADAVERTCMGIGLPKEKIARMSTFLRSAWECLQKLPWEVKNDLKNHLDNIFGALRFAGTMYSRNLSPAAAKKLLQETASQTYNTIKDYLDAAFAAIRHYPRRSTVIQGGNNNELIRGTGENNQGNPSRGNGEPVDFQPGAAERQSTAKGNGENLSRNNAEVDGRAEVGSAGSSASVSGSRSAAGRTQGNQQGSSQAADGTGRSAGNTDGVRSDRTGKTGTSIHDAQGTGVPKPASKRAHGNENVGGAGQTAARAVLEQREIPDSKPIKAGDAKDIADTLPVLLPEQCDDVQKIEKRFYENKQKGILIANGTGTGKTFVGLGEIKRVFMSGKRRILIAVPGKNIAENWIEESKKGGFGLEKYMQIVTTSGTSPDGISIITYDSLFQNKDLLKQNWDMIACDEAHNLSAGNNTSEDSPTKAVNALRALTGHKEGLKGWMTLLHGDLETQIAAKEKEIKDLEKAQDIVSMSREAKGKISATLKAAEETLAKLRAEYQKKLQAERPRFEAYKKNAGNTKTLFLSATPFAYAHNVYYAEGFLFDYGEYGNFNSLMTQRFGYIISKNGRAMPRKDANGRLEPNTINEIAFHNELLKSGAMSKRRLVVDQDYNRKFVKVKSDLANKIDLGFTTLRRAGYNYEASGFLDIMKRRYDYTSQMRMLESAKAESAVAMIKDYIAQGKKVVLFHDFKKEEPVPHPFKLSNEEIKELTAEQKRDYQHFAQEHPEFVNMDVGASKSASAIMKEAFGKDVLEISGDINAENRKNAQRIFNDDYSTSEGRDDKTNGNLIVITAAAGKEGISLHDTTGAHPRVLINIGITARPTDMIQLEGRIYRTGQKSNAQFRYLTTGTGMEERAYFDRAASRSGTAENLALGDDARAMREVLMHGYQQASLAKNENFSALNDSENSGGKEFDNRNPDDIISDLYRMAASKNTSEYMRGKIQEILDDINAREDAKKRAGILTKKNEVAFVQSLREGFKGCRRVDRITDGVYMVELANGRNVWIDLNTTQAEVLGQMSPEAKKQMLTAADIKGSGYEIQGYYTQEYRAEAGAVVDVIHLTEAAKNGTMDHEIMHFVHNALLTTKEKAYLFDYYKNRLKRELGAVEFSKLTDQQVLGRCEEMECDQYAAFCKENSKLRNLVEKLFWKMKKWLTEFANRFGVNTTMGIYASVKGGRMFNRGADYSAKQVANATRTTEVEQSLEGKAIQSVIETTEQPNGSLKFSVKPVEKVGDKYTPDLVKAVLASANRQADADGIKAGMIEITQKEKTAQEKAGSESPVFETLTSPSRMAEKYPVFKSFFNIFDKAQRVQERLRERWHKQFDGALASLKSVEQKDEFESIMLTGEMDGMEYSREQLKEKGYSNEAIKAYRDTRQLIANIWEGLNDAHRGLQKITSAVSSHELNELMHDRFVENLRVRERNSDKFVDPRSINVIAGLDYEVKYQKGKVYKSSKEQLTQEQYDELKASPYAKILKVRKQTFVGGDFEYYECDVERIVPPIGKITGYLPHIFERWMILVNTEDGLQPVGSAKTTKEAVKIAEEMQKDNPKLNFSIRPKMFNPSEYLGGVDEAGGAGSPITLSDEEYVKLQRALVANSTMSLQEAKDALRASARTNSKNRFFGNLLRRKGRAGYNTDFVASLDRYITMSSRYIALQPAKSKAIPLYERTFGIGMESEVPKDMPMARIVKDYIEHNNGNPTHYEAYWNDKLNNSEIYRKYIGATFGDRALLALWGKVNGLVSTAKLGFFNISSALVNMSQLKGAYAFCGESGMAKGIAAFKRVMSNPATDDAKAKRLRDVRVLAEVGVPYDIGYDTVSGYTKRRSAPKNRAADALHRLQGAYNTFADKGMILFKKSEVATRYITTLAAYHTAIGNGMTHKAAVAYAREINRKVNFDYGAADAPGLFRRYKGKFAGLTDLALLFQKYPVKELEMMREMFPYIGQGSTAQKARYWGMYFLLGGLFGFPGADWLDETLEEFLGYKPSIMAKAYLFKEFGDNPMTRTAIYGAPSIAGVDASRRVAMADLVPDNDSMLAYLTGAAGSTISQLVEAVINGEPVKVAKAWSPALGHALEAAQGYRTNSRGQIAFQYKGMNRLLKATGFRPVEESIMSDMQSAAYYDKQVYRSDRQSVIQYAVMKQMSGQELTAEDKKKLREYNVTGTQLRAARKKMMQTAKERLKDNMTKRQKQEFKNTPVFSDEE